VATPPSRPLDAVLPLSPFEADGCDIRAEEFRTSLPGFRGGAPRNSLSLMALWRLSRVSSTVDLTEFSGRGRSGGPNGVGPGLLQEARAKLARPTVQSERPGLPAGAFAFCGVRTAFCDKGLRARRSPLLQHGVGQRRGAAGALADRCGRLGGLSLRASDGLAGVSVSGSVFPWRADTNA